MSLLRGRGTSYPKNGFSHTDCYSKDEIVFFISNGHRLEFPNYAVLYTV